MKIEEIYKVLKDLDDNEIIKEYDNVHSELLSEPHDENTLMLQHCFQIEMAERFMKIIWRKDEK
jgi:hypothetical protein